MPGSYSLAEVLKAQAALRATANLPSEEFSIPAFVGMMSDEIEAARQSGRSDEEIARVIQENSAISITAAEIAQYYAAPEKRH